MSKRLDWKQKQFLADAEKCEKSPELILGDYVVEPEELTRWLKSKTFMREFAAMRERSNWRFDLELMCAARVAARRLWGAAYRDKGGVPTPREVQNAINTVRLARAVRDQEVRRIATAQAKAMRKTDVDSWLGYHPKHSPERAAALLKRIQEEEERANRTEMGQDEDGKWVPLD